MGRLRKVETATGLIQVTSSMAFVSFFFFFFKFLAALQGMWDLSSLTRDGTRTSCIRSIEF